MDKYIKMLVYKLKDKINYSVMYMIKYEGRNGSANTLCNTLPPANLDGVRVKAHQKLPLRGKRRQS